MMQVTSALPIHDTDNIHTYIHVFVSAEKGISLCSGYRGKLAIPSYTHTRPCIMPKKALLKEIQVCRQIDYSTANINTVCYTVKFTGYSESNLQFVHNIVPTLLHTCTLY